MSEKKRPTRKDLRKFGAIMAAGFAVIAAIAFWREHAPTWQVLAGISGFFLIFGLILPDVLRPIEFVWMKFAYILGTIMTFIIVTLTFFIVITPIGLLTRIAGKDLLSLKFNKNLPSYWVKTEPDGPGSRPDKPY